MSSRTSKRVVELLITASLFASGCSAGPASTGPSTGTAASTSGGERPVARPIEPSRGTTVEPPHAMSRAEFDAQWAERRPVEPAPLDFGEDMTVGAPSGPYAAYGGMGADIEHPIATCGASDSYALVASYVCSDGSMPLGGSVTAGADARAGNVGANSTGHIIDLYIVPCPMGPVELYVDLYGCPGGGSPF